MWFSQKSWSRAKIDYPQAGRYSSDEAGVIREHIRLARSAGITGFVVSWKDTGVNDRRLELLMRIARAEHFGLALIYQGLDFNRRPLPVARVEADLRLFVSRYAADPVFGIFDKPLVIWSGTWRYSRSDVARVTTPLRDRVLLLGTEKSAEGYQRIADLVDGDAYYWSSVNPATNRGYPAKLRAMSDAVHAHGGRWIAPFAPGFDARLVGGTKSVPRLGGATLRSEYNAAIDSSPDALGLISWNEFSENTHVEPSVEHGDQALQVLREIARTKPRSADEASAMDSSDSMTDPPRRIASTALSLAAVGLGVLLVLLVPLGLRRRQRRRFGSNDEYGGKSSKGT
jgi:hypothetical protein